MTYSLRLKTFKFLRTKDFGFFGKRKLEGNPEIFVEFSQITTENACLNILFKKRTFWEQKQFSEMFYTERCSITPVPESSFNKVADLYPFLYVIPSSVG